MARKAEAKKGAKTEIDLTEEESLKLGMILDRLDVQSPDGTSLENYIKSLMHRFEGREHLIAALLERLSRRPSAVGFQAFLMLRDTLKTKQHRKLSKQVAYRFAQRGFTEPAPSAPETVVLVGKEDRRPVAHLLPADGTVWMITALIPESGYPTPTWFSAFLDGSLGRVEAKVAEGSQRTYREFLQKFAEVHSDRKACAVPIHHAARLFFEMLEMSHNTEETPSLEQARRLLKPYHDPDQPPHVYTLMPPVENPERAIQDVKPEELLRIVDLSGLIFAKEDLAPYWQKVQDLDNPVLVIPREIQEDRTVELIEKASDELCTGRRRFLYRRFFEEQALWLKLSGMDEPATAAWVVAQHLMAGHAAGKNPVVFQMVMISMRIHWPNDFDKQGGQPEEPFYRSESGLILPS